MSSPSGKTSLLHEYDQAEENARSLFSQEKFQDSLHAWEEAARLASLIRRNDLLARAHRHCSFAYHGMGKLREADEARQRADRLVDWFLE